MITDIIINLFLKKDPFLKRNLIKAFSWRVVGSIETVFIVLLFSGNFSISVKVGIVEFILKMLIYYIHEKLWQQFKFGIPSRHKQAQITHKEIKPNLFKQTGKVTRQDRERLNGNNSFTLWLTGLSGAGKSTIASEIEEWIYSQGIRAYILDGDNTRLGINSDLSFSDEDRSENIRRVAEIARLFNDAGVVVIASFISPFHKDRLLAKQLIGKVNFIEIYVDASIEVCRKRDTKGLYKLASRGKIKNFTGVNSPYEPPEHPDLILKTDGVSVETCLAEILPLLSSRIYNSQIIN